MSARTAGPELHHRGIAHCKNEGRFWSPAVSTAFPVSSAKPNYEKVVHLSCPVSSSYKRCDSSNVYLVSKISIKHWTYRY